MNPNCTAFAELKIRRASLKDLDNIRAFGREFYRHGEAQSESDRALHEYVDGVFARMWSEDYLRFVLQHESCSAVVAQCGAEIAGMALALPMAGDSMAAALSRLCLLAPYRDGPVLQHLLAVCEQCLPQAVQRVESCVPQVDAAQLLFYESQGFQRRGVVEIGRRPHASCFVELSKPLRRARLGHRDATTVRVLREHGWN